MTFTQEQHNSDFDRIKREQLSPDSPRFVLELPTTGFFNTRAYLDGTRPDYTDEYSFQHLAVAKNTPNKLPLVLHDEATKLISTLSPESLMVPIYLGGKGRFIGTRLVEIMKIKSGDVSRICEMGEKGAINIGGALIRELKGHAELDPTLESLSEDGRKVLVRNVERSDDPVMNGLKNEMERFVFMARKQAMERGRAKIDYLIIDDQSISTTTKTVAELLLEDSMRIQNERNGRSIEQRVHMAVDLAPQWEHAPTYFVNLSVSSAIPEVRLINALGILDMPLPEDGLANEKKGRRSNVAALLRASNLSEEHKRGVAQWINYVRSEVKNYVIRGGYAGRDENGTPLLTQYKCPDDVLRFRTNLLGKDAEVIVDTQKVVEAYNTEFDHLILG